VEADQRVIGQFSLDTLCASTGALASDTAGDATYTNTENALASLGAQRDGLPTRSGWRSGTPSRDRKIDPQTAKDWIKQGQAI